MKAACTAASLRPCPSPWSFRRNPRFSVGTPQLPRPAPPAMRSPPGRPLLHIATLRRITT
eukprot:scaffold36003_cov76-Phaeocystis_antarctica.AAC.1